MIVEPYGAFEGTVTLIWATPLLSVKVWFELTYVEFNIWLGPEGGCNVALKSICTFGLGAPVEFASFAWNTTVWFGFAEMLPAAGEIQFSWSLCRATSLPVALPTKLMAEVSIDDGRLNSLGL